MAHFDIVHRLGMNNCMENCGRTGYLLLRHFLFTGAGIFVLQSSRTTVNHILS